MNCDEFQHRMHQCLDDRLSMDSDRDLSRHARQCEFCRVRMQAWSQIASVMSDRPATPAATAPVLMESRPDADSNHSRFALRNVAGLAAAMLIAMVAVWYAASPSSSPLVDSGDGVVDAAGVDEGELMLAQTTSRLDPADWWRSVQDRDWVSQTMPTVQSVKDGVAPIGRSLMRAVAILTLGGDGQTS